MKISVRKKLVPKFLSKNKRIKAVKRTGKVSSPSMEVKRKAHTVNGILFKVIPLVLLLITVAIIFMEVIVVDTIKINMLIIQKSIPAPDPIDADFNALKGGYAVHPALAVPVSRKKE